MIYKYIVLQGGRGIAIFIELKEHLDPFLQPSDIKICDRIFLQISGHQLLSKSIIEQWLSKAIIDLSAQLHSISNGKNICYELLNLDFDHAHFQAEALYPATQGWLGKYYNIEVAPTDFYFSKTENKFIFPSLINCD